MCGIVGSLNRRGDGPPDISTLRRMLGLIAHRGPDAFGIYRDDFVGLGSSRLSIVDLDSGNQPIHNEDQTIWIVFNGEVFNYVELREELLARGHRFATFTDTEVIVHLYEERGERCVEALNGQFAFAIWDSRTRALLLGRDRLGIRPLFYALDGDHLAFGSEIKAIFADPRVSRELDPRALDQVFTCWAPLPGHSAFRAVKELPAGHTLTIGPDGMRLRRYWSLRFPNVDERTDADRRSEGEYVAAFRELLVDATRLRLRADVPVGAYLSGGLDSSTIAALVQRENPNLQTFSITFDDASFDESRFQERMARRLQVQHQTVHCASADIGRVFPEVVWHAETPLLRTAPAPMYLLSRQVRNAGFKVVLTGEGADEILAGYDIFKEDRVRRFWARNPASTWRSLLLRRLYADVRGLQRSDHRYLEAFFKNGLADVDQKGYSHRLRWRNTARLKSFFSESTTAALADYDVDADLDTTLDDAIRSWHPLNQAQYVESTIFLSQYLLSSQGDRVAMANSVEGRFPFLDYRLVEFCSRVPPRLKLRGLTEKYLLKRSVEGLVPEEIRSRLKKPYRAPIQAAFFSADSGYVDELLSAEAIRRAGYFNPAAVARLVEKARRVPELSEMDSMAVVGVLSVQLLDQYFVRGFPAVGAVPLPELSVVVDRSGAQMMAR